MRCVCGQCREMRHGCEADWGVLETVHDVLGGYLGAQIVRMSDCAVDSLLIGGRQHFRHSPKQTLNSRLQIEEGGGGPAGSACHGCDRGASSSSPGSLREGRLVGACHGYDRGVSSSSPESLHCEAFGPWAPPTPPSFAEAGVELPAPDRGGLKRLPRL